MKNSYFITGTGTGIGKTFVSAILTEALEADYWKPVQAGYENGTDSDWVRAMVSHQQTVIHPETYKLKLAASPHIAAREEGVDISLEKIFAAYSTMAFGEKNLVIEGAGGLMVPLNDHEFVLDLIIKLNCRVILVSKNYLGSINHSLLTAHLCRQKRLRVAGWIFNDHFMDYEDEIVKWSGYPALGSIPRLENPGKEQVREWANHIKEDLKTLL